MIVKTDNQVRRDPKQDYPFPQVTRIQPQDRSHLYPRFRSDGSEHEGTRRQGYRWMVRVSTPLYCGENALTIRGPPLIEFMDNMEILDRDVNAPFMFPVSEKYNEMGTMVMGKIESGRVKKGDTVLVMPNKVSSRVLANRERS